MIQFLVREFKVDSLEAPVEKWKNFSENSRLHIFWELGFAHGESDPLSEASSSVERFKLYLLKTVNLSKIVMNNQLNTDKRLNLLIYFDIFIAFLCQCYCSV